MLRDPPYKVQHSSSAEEFTGMDGVVCPNLIIWGPSVPVVALKPGIAVFGSRFPDRAEPVRHVILADAPNARAIRRLAALDVEALLLVDISSEVLNRSLELVMLGQRLFPVARRQVREAGQAEVVPFPVNIRRIRDDVPASAGHEVVLSGRESQILRHLVGGASNKAIARALQITEATVKVHIKGLLRKARVANRTQAAMWALQNRYRVVGEGDGPAQEAGD